MNPKVRLTSLAACAGCAAKFSPEDLRRLLAELPPVADPNLLVGTATADDAAVYQLSPDLALVQTVDFFPPIVDDPYLFGAIAATNALSDVYAMGGKPITALSIVCFPALGLERSILTEILKGAADKVREAGCLLVGGHTIDDKEPKYGLAVTGVVRPGQQVTNAGAQPGDVLLLTKPLGTGIIATALKAEMAPGEALDRAVDLMTTLNRAASEAMVEVGVHAATDVTGYGLLGHLKGMVDGSGVGATVYLSRVPVIPGTWELVRQGLIPAGSHRIVTYVESAVRWSPEISLEAKLLLCDPQTSGGLLMAVPPARKDRLVAALQRRGVPCIAEVGEIEGGEPGVIRIAP